MPKKTSVDLSTYVKNDADPLSLRCADFLHWLSKKSPEIFVAPNVAVKAIMGYGHTPRIGSDEVIKLRQRYGTIRKILRKKHNQDLIIESGAGIRASVNSADVLVSSLPKYVTRLDRARTAVIQVDNLIDMKTVPNTPALAPYRNMHNLQIKPLIKELTKPSFMAMLALPSTTTDDGDGDGNP